MSDLRDEFLQLKETNAQLVVDLEQCQDKLFELLRKQNDTPEQVIKESFARILGGTEAWIDEISSHEKFNFKHQWEKYIHHRKRANRFSDYGFPHRCNDVTWQVKLGKLHTVHYVILSQIIGRCLFEDIIRGPPEEKEAWHTILPFGLEPNDKSFLERVQLSMSGEIMKRDYSQIARWRGETVAAITSRHEFRVSSSDVERKEIYSDLREELIEWTGKEAFHDHELTLLRDVIDPAIELTRIIGSSHKVYTLERFSSVPQESHHRSTDFDSKDITNWKTVSSSSIDRSFHCLYPALVRKGFPGEEDRILVRPVMLGYPSPEWKPVSRPPSPLKPKLESGRSDLEGSETKVSRAPPGPSSRQSADKKGPRPNMMAQLGSVLGLQPLPSQEGYLSEIQASSRARRSARQLPSKSGSRRGSVSESTRRDLTFSMLSPEGRIIEQPNENISQNIVPKIKEGVCQWAYQDQHTNCSQDVNKFY